MPRARAPPARAPRCARRAHVRCRPRRPLLPLKASEGRAGFHFSRGAAPRGARRARVCHTVLLCEIYPCLAHDTAAQETL